MPGKEYQSSESRRAGQGAVITKVGGKDLPEGIVYTVTKTEDAGRTAPGLTQRSLDALERLIQQSADNRADADGT